jgi:hydroxyacylglutathione hydrolase
MSIEKLAVDNLKSLQENNPAQIIDVRRPEEFALGHIPFAINLPLDTINLTDIQPFLDKNLTLVLNCQRGIRSLKACTLLLQQNTQLTLYNLEGGYEAYCQNI